MRTCYGRPDAISAGGRSSPPRQPATPPPPARAAKADTLPTRRPRSAWNIGQTGTSREKWAPAPPLVTCRGLPGPAESRRPGQPRPRTKPPGQPRCRRRHPGPAITAGGRSSPPRQPATPPPPARAAKVDTPAPPGIAARPERAGENGHRHRP